MRVPEHRVVLVTGCSKGGIGYALCHEMAAKGCIVYATARRLGLLEGLEQLGCRLHELDVTDAAAVQRVTDLIIKECGKIDILVNNAGSMIKGWAVDTPLGEVRQLMEVNFFAVLAVSQAVAPHMIARKKGAIVNISSSCAFISLPQASAYCASKFAVRAYSDALRVELAPFGIHVMHVAPGFIRTQLFRSNNTVKLKEDSPYLRYEHAMQLLKASELSSGIGGWGATDPQVFARRLTNAVLRSRLPASFHDGWMWRVFYYLGCFAPLWLTDLISTTRLQLWR